MSNSFTTTSTQGFFSRIMNSFVGILLGPVIIVLAIWLLGWNEGRAVEAIKGLGEAASVVVEAPADAVSPANEGKLVHVVGKAEAAGPIQDSNLGIKFDNQVAVNRTVELYQWKEKKEEKTQDNTGGSQTTTTTYTYTKEWSEGYIDSSAFAHPEGHENPKPDFDSQSFVADDAKLGGFTLDGDTLGLIGTANALQTDTVPDGWVKNGSNLYKGENPAVPAVGDMRVHYTSLPSGTTVSVLAAQSHDGFAAYKTSVGYEVHLARSGNATAAEMIAAKQSEEATMTWIWRAVGTFGIFMGFAMFFGPIATLASVLPFLGTLVRGATTFFAFVLTIPVALITIAISWLVFRPLYGGGLLVLAAGALYGMWRWHHARSAPRVAAAAAAAAASPPAH